MHYKILVFHRKISYLFRRKPKTTFFALYTPLCVCVSAVKLGFPFSFPFCSEVDVFVWFVVHHQLWKNFFPAHLGTQNKSTHLHSHCLCRFGPDSLTYTQAPPPGGVRVVSDWPWFDNKPLSCTRMCTKFSNTLPTLSQKLTRLS